MSQAVVTPGSSTAVEVPTIPLAELAPWALFFISADQGAVSIPSGNAIHEWVHDGRHLLGFPCH